ncbi:kinesin-like protein KIF19 isoform X2 [Hermetia illucens]|uniref:kinesin-like protein KIF19 isoform X2 n=1 Tax=Hermetia illucens TaxID=343691 RepID=UPI0018CBF6DA|nr:kinesin-like protein KIF19 isoform X2 [Hermetia illucens]
MSRQGTGNWSSGSGSGSGGSGSSQLPSTAMSQSGEERLVVAVRVRPSTEPNNNKCIQILSDRALLFDDGSKNRPRKYVYDFVFGESSTQEEVYKTTTAPLVKDVLNGLNAAVFAYGATGAGKTHTMLGPNPKKAGTPSSELPPKTAQSNHGDGMMVKALDEIFQHVENAEDSSKFKVTISYLEIYNELIRDLLNPGGPLELREDNRGQKITVAGLSEITTCSRHEVIQNLLKGNKARTMEPTAANKTSSRSHALLSVTVQNKTPLGTKQGRLFLTDLAGSERAKKTKNRGKRLQEGAHINRSLLALGNCINALSGGARYVNYRDSKLTRLLKEALSGKCKTVMIAHVAPEARHRDETKNTLVYADRANHISTRLQNAGYIDETQNIPMKHYQNLVSELREEVSRLRSKMLQERPRSGAAAAANNNINDEKRKAELRYLREQIVHTFKQQMKLRRKLLEAESHLLGLELDAERQHMVISHWQGRMGKLYDQVNDEESEGNTALKNAWEELAAIEKETKRFREIRERTEQELEMCRQKGVQLEDELPERISSDEERELLALLCRVHELEADKVSLQAERLARQAELRRRDLQLLRAERQRRLCEDIISSQRRLIEESQIELPDELKELYGLYQQEIHASTVNSTIVTPRNLYENKLPPINSGGQNSPGGSSSSGSDWDPSPLPPIDPQNPDQFAQDGPDRLMGPPVAPRLPSIATGKRANGYEHLNSTSSEE